MTNEAIDALAATAPIEAVQKESFHNNGKHLDVKQWLIDHEIVIASEGPYGKGGTRYILEQCPFNAEHKGTSCAIIQYANGAIKFKCQHSECIKAGNDWKKLRELKDPEYKERRDTLQSIDDTLPIIVSNGRQLRDITEDALRALEDANIPKPILFRFGSGLGRISHDDRRHPFTEQVIPTVVRYHLSKAASFARFDPNGTAHHCLPPLELCANIMVAGADWHFPPLMGIVEGPTLRPDFSILDTPGYDERTGLYLEPTPGLEIEPIPQNPSDSQLQDAADLVKEPIVDFLFVNEASRANMTAAFLLPSIRDAITGPVPLTLITKPQPGCGGSLSVDCVAIIATGRSARVVQAPREPEEWRKLLTSLLVSGERYIIFDNIDRQLESEYLASFLTTMWWRDRLLGQTQQIELPNRSIVFANGNNASVGGNLARRIIPVEMDSTVAKVWMRDVNQFKHPQLRDWVSETRGHIISATLTIVRGWVNAGKPKPENLLTLASFESYCEIVGSLLHFMGIKGFLGNLEHLYDKIDTDTPVWANFFEVWKTKFKDNSVTVAELVEYLRYEDYKDLKSALPINVYDKEGKVNVRRLGNQLAKREGQKFDNGLKLTRDGDFRRAVKWLVVSFENETHTKLNSNESFESSKPPIARENRDIKKEQKINKVVEPELNSQNSQFTLDSCLTSKLTQNDTPSLTKIPADTLEVWCADGMPPVIVPGGTIGDLEKFLKGEIMPDGYAASIIKYVHEARGRVEKQ